MEYQIGGFQRSQYAKDKYLDRICKVSNNLENEIRTALNKKL